VAQRASGLDRSEPTGRRQGAPRIGRLDFVRRMPQWNLDLGTGRRERTTTRLSCGFGFLFVVRPDFSLRSPSFWLEFLSAG
jgi:hypothetical protein